MEDRRDEWLSLSEASELLGVHPVTLRRWANRGILPTIRTPGGHRRFRRQDVEALMRIRREEVEPDFSLPPGEQTLPEWMEAFQDPELLQRIRERGQRLLGLLVRYLTAAAGEEQERFLTEAYRLGVEYGRDTARHGIDLRRTLEAYLFHSAAALETGIQLQLTNNRAVEEISRTVRRTYLLLGQVLLGTLEGHQAEWTGRAIREREAAILRQRNNHEKGTEAPEEAQAEEAEEEA